MSNEPTLSDWQLTQYESRDDYDEWAKAVTTKPDSYAGPIGERDYGCVYSWASRGDDRMAEVNYKAIVADLEGVDAHLEDDPDYTLPEWETWYDGGASHWLVGVLEQIIVRVYDDDGEPTPHGVAAWRCYLALCDYPCLDDSALSELEWADFLEDVDECLGKMAWAYDDGDDEDAIKASVLAGLEQSGRDMGGDSQEAWAWIEENYGHHRDTYYVAKAERFMAETADALREAEAAHYDGDLLTLIVG